MAASLRQALANTLSKIYVDVPTLRMIIEEQRQAIQAVLKNWLILSLLISHPSFNS